MPAKRKTKRAAGAGPKRKSRKRPLGKRARATRAAVARHRNAFGDTYRPWKAKGFRAGVSGRFRDMYSAWNAAAGKPKKTGDIGKYAGAHEGFFEGFLQGQEAREKRMKKNPSRKHSRKRSAARRRPRAAAGTPKKAKFGSWYKGPKGTRVRVTRRRGQIVVDVRK